MYVGNIYPREDNLGFKDTILGWDSLYNDTIEDLTLTSESTQNLLDVVFLQSLNKEREFYYNKLSYTGLPISYPLGRCLRLVLNYVLTDKANYRFLFSIKIEETEELTPIVFGLFINQSLLKLNNITDINIFFNDPLNDIKFAPSKVSTWCPKKAKL